MKEVKKGLPELLQSFLSEGGYYSDSHVSRNGDLKVKQIELNDLLALLKSGESPQKETIFNILQDIQVGENAYFKIGDINVTDKMVTYSEVTQNQIDYVNTYHDNSSTTFNNHYHFESNNSASSSKPYTKKHWQLPERNPFFVGRKKLLEQIKGHLDEQSIGVVSQSLTGLGGVGKTHLALEYANNACDKNQYDVVVWLSGQLLQQEFERLAHDVLGMQNVKDYVQQRQKLLNKIYHELSDRYSRLLIVIDDVKDEKTVQDYLPKTRWPRDKICHVLLTSRAHTWSKAKRIVIGSFTQEEAIKYIRKSSLEQSIGLANAKALADGLGCFPLALCQAVAYLRENEDLSVNDYLSDYNSTTEQCRKLLSYSIVADTTSQEENDKKLAVYTTWYISIQQLRKTHPKAEIVLNLASFLPSQKVPHPIIRLAMGMDKASGKSAFSELLSALRSYSLITSRMSKDSTEEVYPYFTMHQLMQQVIRLHLSEERFSYKKDESLLNTFSAFITRTFRQSNNTHANSAESLPDKSTPAQTQVKADLPGHWSDFSTSLKAHLQGPTATLKTYWLARLLWTVSRYYKNDELDPKNYPMVQTLYPSAHEVATLSDKEGFITEESCILWCELGYYQIFSRSEGALGLSHSQRAVAIYQSMGKPKNLVYAGLLVNQANAYGLLGNYQKKKSLLAEALPILEKHYGRTHPLVAKTLTNLGGAYNDLGKPGEAKTYLQRALTIKEKHYGRTHPEVANTLTSLGAAYIALGEPDEAKTHLHRALRINEKHYGRTHPEVAKTLTNLGNAYLTLGEPGEAKTHIHRALAINENHYGHTHPEVAITLMNLGNAYRALGEPGEAKTHLHRALTIEEKHYGRTHPEVAKTLTNLGAAYLDLGEPGEAKTHLHRALTIEEKHYGRTHPEVAITLTNLGAAYIDLGEPGEAKTHLHRALMIKEKHYGSNHQETAITRAILGKTYEAAGEIEEAITCYKHSLPILKRAKVVWVSEIEEALQRCLSESSSMRPNQSSTGKSSMNASFFKQSEEPLQIEQASRAKNQAGLVLFKAGKYKEALPLFLEALSLGEVCYTVEEKQASLSLASLYYNTGVCYQALKELDAAKTYLEKSLALRAVYLAKSDKDYQEVQKRLATLTVSTSDDSQRLSRN